MEGPAVAFVATDVGTGAGEEAVADAEASGVEAAGVAADMALAKSADSSAACNYHQGRRMSRRAKGLLTRRDMDTLKLVDASEPRAPNHNNSGHMRANGSRSSEKAETFVNYSRTNLHH